MDKSNSTPLNIISAGCVFPGGSSLALADCALRAQLTLFRQHPYYKDQCGQPIRVSYFRGLKDFGIQRWIELAQEALHDLYLQLPQPVPRWVQAGSLRLYVCLPEQDRLGLPVDIEEHIKAACFNGPFKLNDIQFIRGGHACALKGLALINQDSADSRQASIVLAVDSWLHHESMMQLEFQGLLHKGATVYRNEAYTNPYGRMPSEAAAAVMIFGHRNHWCQIVGMGMADEPVLRTSTAPCIAQGWSEAANLALKNLPPDRKISHVITDMNGEPYRAEQLGFTALRIAPHLASNWERITPALVTGDVGTATVLVHLALSANRLRCLNAWERPQTHLLLSASDDSLRSALVLRNA